MILARRNQLRETAARAIRYHGENLLGTSIRSAVIGACATMLFDATDAETMEIIELVLQARTRRR